MLRRTLAFAARADGAGDARSAAGRSAPIYCWTAMARWPSRRRMRADRASVRAGDPSPATPPGLYERAGVSAAIDAARADDRSPRLCCRRRAPRGLGAVIERPLAGWLFGAAALGDRFADRAVADRALAASGAARRRGGGAGGARAAGAPGRRRRRATIHAQHRLACTHGDARLDRQSQAGLQR